MNLFSISDLSDSELDSILNRGGEHFLAQDHEPTLKNMVIGIFFTKSSTRTRTAFSTAALRLGAGLISYGPEDLQLITGESPEDTGRVLATMIDALVIRTSEDPGDMKALSADRTLPVVNAMSADEHPTQALSDLTYLKVRLKTLEGLRVLYLGEGNNTATALCLALSRQRSARIDFRTPPGYGLPTSIVEDGVSTARKTGAVISEAHHLEDLPEDVDVVYTTRWQTTGTVKANPDWRSTFQLFKVTEELLDRYPNAIFMHDLPAHRGEEVDHAVIDGPASVVFDQAAFKMYSAMAVLEWALDKLPQGILPRFPASE